MNKADKMVEMNRQRHSNQEKKAIEIINKMLVDDEQVTISELVKRTHMSRSYFYNNEKIANEVARAKSIQVGKEYGAKRKDTLDKALGLENAKLKKELGEATKKIAELTKIVGEQEIKIKKLLNQRMEKIK